MLPRSYHGYISAQDDLLSLLLTYMYSKTVSPLPPSAPQQRGCESGMGERKVLIIFKGMIIKKYSFHQRYRLRYHRPECSTARCRYMGDRSMKVSG